MLFVPLKTTKPMDWSVPLRNYLEQNYTPDSLYEHANSIQRLSTLRESLQSSFMPGGSVGSVELIERYLRMLNQLQPRFPLDGDGGIEIQFVWYDALNRDNSVSMNNISFERYCMLFNLGASFSYQGTLQVYISFSFTQPISNMFYSQGSY